MGKAVKHTFSLSSPFADPVWPSLAPQDEKAILDLLCSLLAPIGEHRRRHVIQSKGKREKKRKRLSKEESTSILAQQIVPPVPDVTNHISVGFNSTVRSLSCSLAHPIPNFNKQASPTGSAGDRGYSTDSKLAAIFVDRSTVPEALWLQMPLLVDQAADIQPPNIRPRLLPLSGGAESQLKTALGIPRVGIVGICENAPGARSLLDFVFKSTKPIDIPWTKELQNMAYLPVKIDVTTSEVVAKPQKVGTAKRP